MEIADEGGPTGVGEHDAGPRAEVSWPEGNLGVSPAAIIARNWRIL
jgi:hypothetical protein